MSRTIVAVPSMNPGGMDAEPSGHFGRCELYTIAEIEDDKIVNCSVLDNMPHVEGGCQAPVKLLAERGVQALITGCMGMRPFMGFQQAGIDVFQGSLNIKVGDNINAFMEGRLPQFTIASACGGH